MNYLISIVSVVIVFNFATASTERDIERQSSGNANSYNSYNNYDKNENYDSPNRYRTSGDNAANSNYLSGIGGGYYPRTVYDNFNYNKLNEPNSYSTGGGGGNGGDQYGGSGGASGGPSNFYAPAVLAAPQYNPFLTQQRFNPLLAAASPGNMLGFMANSPASIAYLQQAVSPYMGNINYAMLSSAPIENQNYGYNGLYSSPALYGGYGSVGKIGIGDTPTSAAHGIANYGNFLANPLANPFYGLNIGGLGLINNRQSLISSDSPYGSAPYHNNYINNNNNNGPHVAYGAQSSQYSPLQLQSLQNSQQMSNYASNANLHASYANLNRALGGNGFAASPLHPYQALSLTGGSGSGGGSSSSGQQNSYNSNAFDSQRTNDNYNSDKTYVSSASKTNEKVTSHSNVKSDDRWM